MTMGLAGMMTETTVVGLYIVGLGYPALDGPSKPLTTRACDAFRGRRHEVTPLELRSSMSSASFGSEWGQHEIRYMGWQHIDG